MGRRCLKVNALAMALMLDAMLEGPQSISDLVDITGLHQVTLRAWIKTLRSKKVVYVADWEMDSNQHLTLRCYMLGRNKDIEKVVPTKAQRMKVYYQKTKQKRMLAITAGVIKA